jgi:ectoine hydroxylase-related dioxygenase (phytanoyl-CoA dioxygenase family)
MNEQVEFATMSDRERYLFDLQGFLVVRGILSADEVNALNEALEANLDKRGEFGKPNAISGNWEGRSLEGRFSPFRHYKGMLTWEQPWCQPFRDMLAHPKVIPYLNTLLGRGWKLDHGVDLLNSVEGCEGLKLHGSGNLTFSGSRFYAYQNGRMRCGLIVLQYSLTDVNPGDGGLCVIPGSHKGNFPAPDDIMTWEANEEVVFQPTIKAGDLVIFNEATTHGTLPWKGQGERRTLLFRYTPKYLHYSGGAYEIHLPDWVSELTEAQQAVLEPPYVYAHPLIEDDGVGVVRPRREGE